MRIENCTPHEITIVRPEDKGWSNLVLQPSGILPRVEMTRREVAWLEDPDGYYIGVNEVGLGAVSGLPDEQSDVALIVSRQVAEACPSRRNLFIVDETVRDEAGRIVGCRSLAQVPAPSQDVPERIEAASAQVAAPDSGYGELESEREPERSGWGAGAQAEWRRQNRREPRRFG